MMQKTTVLFVDDDPSCLAAIRRLLLPMRRYWDLHFAGSGREALQFLHHNPCDVIVTDMKMPEMDGATLLNKTIEIQPDMVRIMLSGHSEKQRIMDAIGPMHQFLAKPCPAEKLISTINRTVALRRIVKNEKLKGVVSKLESIPSLPELYTELSAEINSPDASLSRVAKIVARDPGMTAKILQIINSAYFGLPKRVQNIQQAVNLLGMEIISALVLNTQIFSEFKIRDSKAFSSESLWQHNINVALTAKAIAGEAGCSRDVQDQAFMGGMLHDVGKLILQTTFRDEYDEVILAAADAETSLWQAELQYFDASHTEVGAYLLGLWGLSDEIVEIVAYHHLPGYGYNTNFNALTAVHIANSLDAEVNKIYPLVKSCGFDKEYLDSLGIDSEYERWQQIYQEVTGNEYSGEAKNPHR